MLPFAPMLPFAGPQPGAPGGPLAGQPVGMPPQGAPAAQPAPQGFLAGLLPTQENPRGIFGNPLFMGGLRGFSAAQGNQDWGAAMQEGLLGEAKLAAARQKSAAALLQSQLAAGRLALDRRKFKREGQTQWEPIMDDQGNVLGQRNMLTGEVKEDPRAPEVRSPIGRVTPNQYTDPSWDKYVAALQAGEDPVSASRHLEAVPPPPDPASAATASLAKINSLIAQARLDKMNADAEEAKRKREKAEEEALYRGTDQLAAISRARELVMESPTATGFWGGLTQKVYGSPAYRLHARLSRVASSVVTDAMARLKELSATGSTGFGALSEKEMELLRNSKGAIDLALGREELMENLDELERVYRRMVADHNRWRVLRQQQAQGGAGGAPAPAPAGGAAAPQPQRGNPLGLPNP